MIRFGLDRHPFLARVYAALVLLALPIFFLPFWVVAYLPDALRQFASDFMFNVRNAWSILDGSYFRRK